MIVHGSRDKVYLLFKPRPFQLERAYIDRHLRVHWVDESQRYPKHGHDEELSWHRSILASGIHDDLIVPCEYYHYHVYAYLYR